MYRAQNELYQRILAFDFDGGPSARPFASRLAQDNRWSAAYAARVIEEYRRFATLATLAGHPVSPSDAVDQAWHLHMTYSRSYHAFCQEVLGAPLHHEPSRGAPGERARLAGFYENTLASYERFFGEAPPADIWPSPTDKLLDDARYQRVDVAHHWVLPKPPLRNLTALAFGVVALEGLVALAAGHNLSLVQFAPFTWSGPTFIVRYWVALLGAAVLAYLVRWRAAKTPEGARRGTSVALDPYEAAYLREGASRACQVAVASLVARKLLRFDELPRSLSRRGEAPRNLHPMELAVYRAAAGVSFTSLCRAAAREAHVLGLRLKEEGLVVTDARSLRARLLAALPLFALLFVGLTKIGVGMALDRPVTLLVWSSIITFVVGLVALKKALHQTDRGDAVLERLSQEHAAAKDGVGGGDGPFLRWGVALFGASVLAHTALAALGRVMVVQTSSESGGGGDGCSDGGGGGGDGCSDGGDGGGGGGSDSGGGGGGCGGCDG